MAYRGRERSLQIALNLIIINLIFIYVSIKFLKQVYFWFLVYDCVSVCMHTCECGFSCSPEDSVWFSRPRVTDGCGPPDADAGTLGIATEHPSSLRHPLSISPVSGICLFKASGTFVWCCMQRTCPMWYNFVICKIKQRAGLDDTLGALYFWVITIPATEMVNTQGYLWRAKVSRSFLPHVRSP